MVQMTMVSMKVPEHGDQPLTYRVLGLRGSVGDGRTAQAGFIGEDTARHTETDGRRSPPHRQSRQSPRLD